MEAPHGLLRHRGTPQKWSGKLFLLVYWDTEPRASDWGVGALACQVLSQPLLDVRWTGPGPQKREAVCPGHRPRGQPPFCSGESASLHLWVTGGPLLTAAVFFVSSAAFTFCLLLYYY